MELMIPLNCQKKFANPDTPPLFFPPMNARALEWEGVIINLTNPIAKKSKERGIRNLYVKSMSNMKISYIPTNVNKDLLVPMILSILPEIIVEGIPAIAVKE